MKILHTSDLHLSPKKPHTIKALKSILKLAEKEAVNLVTIAGDMFESEADAEKLRPKLRSLLSGNGFDILVIPGNHDLGAFGGDTYYGEDVQVAVKTPFQVEEFHDVVVVALPYREEPDEEIIAALKADSKKRKTSVLMIHCTLDLGFGLFDFGEESTLRYFPISHKTLADLGYDYVLAGHFHCTALFKDLENGGIFIYPGSPVSLSKKEVGRRSVAIIDTEKRKHRPVILNTFYYDQLEVNVRPGTEGVVVKDIRRWVEERSKDNCELEVIVNGFIGQSERTFNNALTNAAKPAYLNPGYLMVKGILSHPLYRRFKKKLDQLEDVANKEMIEDFALEAMSSLAAQRRPTV